MVDDASEGWFRHTLTAIRDDIAIMAAVLNRVDHNQGSILEELRAMRKQVIGLRTRIEAVETDGKERPHQ